MTRAEGPCGEPHAFQVRIAEDTHALMAAFRTRVRDTGAVLADKIAYLKRRRRALQGGVLGALRALAARGAGVARATPLWLANAVELAAPRDIVDAIAQRPDVAAVLPWRAARPPVLEPSAAAPADAGSWGIEALQFPALWREGLRGDGVLVAHMDTGVDASHPDLEGKIAAFLRVDDFGVHAEPAWDMSGHGSHTAGLIVGGAHGGSPIGGAPGARLLSCMVIEGGPWPDRVIQGLQAAAERGVRVVNLSFGCPDVEPLLDDMVASLAWLDIFTVAAIGNVGPGETLSPASAVHAWSVGAVDREGRVAPFSGGAVLPRAEASVQPDICAPGVGIRSCVPGGWETSDGTSMAAALVTAAVALLRQAAPGASVKDLAQVLADTARDLGDPGHDPRYGRGMIDPRAALRRLKPGRSAVF